MSDQSALLGTEIFRTIRDAGDKTLISSAQRDLTGEDIIRQAGSLARVLHKAGVGKGDRIFYYLPGNDDMFVALFASWWLAAVPVLLDFRSRPAQKEKLKALLQPKRVVEARSGGDADVMVFERTWLHGEAHTEPFAGPADFASTPAMIALSSGTTGTPRAYVMSHQRSVYRILRDSEHHKPGGLYFTPMSLSFSATRHMALRSLLAGWQIRFAPSLFSASELVEMIGWSGADIVSLPPPTIRGLCREVGERDTPYFSKLSMLRSSGGPASIEDKLQAYHRLSHHYTMNYSSGLTGTVTTQHGPSLLENPGSVGKPFSHTRIEILDPETGDPLPAGATGVIKAYSPYMAIDVIGGGDGDGEVKAEAFGPDWGIPGDLGVLDDEGFLTIVGRQADMIVRGGINVSPLAVENTLKTDPRIADAGVCGIDDAEYGQEVAAFVVARDMTNPDLHALCMELFAFDQRPRILRIVRSLPYNTNGKLSRKDLPSLL